MPRRRPRRTGRRALGPILSRRLHGIPRADFGTFSPFAASVLILTRSLVVIACVDMSTEYSVRSGADLGRVLRDVRTAHGLTQQQLVDRYELGFDRTRLARIEGGEGFQSLDRALSVLRRLGIEVHATVPELDRPHAAGRNPHHERDAPAWP